MSASGKRPFLGNIGVHSVLPLASANLAIANSETIAEACRSRSTMPPCGHDPAKPVLLSVLPVPAPPRGLPYGNFCDKGGRFGPHNLNQHRQSASVERSDRLVYLTYFNAGRASSTLPSEPPVQ